MESVQRSVAIQLGVMLMAKIATWPQDEQDAIVVPLDAQQARELREREPSLSPWNVVLIQLALGLVLVFCARLFGGSPSLAWSVGYGALVAVVPAALFARGLTSRFSSASAVTAGFGFFVWEAVKIAVSVAMLALAPRFVEDLDWLAMLIGLILTLKVYGLALLMRPKRRIN